MHADLESILWKFGGDPAICVREEAICAIVYRQTDRRRTPRHCISSFFEWAKNEVVKGLVSWLYHRYVRKWFVQICEFMHFVYILYSSENTGVGAKSTLGSTTFMPENIQGGPKKASQRNLHITSSNTGRFPKFLHNNILQEICNKTVITYPTWSILYVRTKCQNFTWHLTENGRNLRDICPKCPNFSWHLLDKYLFLKFGWHVPSPCPPSLTPVQCMSKNWTGIETLQTQRNTITLLCGSNTAAPSLSAQSDDWAAKRASNSVPFDSSIHTNLTRAKIVLAPRDSSSFVLQVPHITHFCRPTCNSVKCLCEVTR